MCSGCRTSPIVTQNEDWVEITKQAVWLAYGTKGTWLLLQSDDDGKTILYDLIHLLLL